MGVNWFEAFFFFPEVLGLLRPGITPWLHGFRLFVVVVPLSFAT
jgi:hypothetical protein